MNESFTRKYYNNYRCLNINLAYIFTDTPLEQWVIHGPFSIDADLWMTNEMSVTTTDAKGNEVNTPLSGHKTLELLMGLLMQPKIEILKDSETKPESVAVKIYAPGFQVGKSTLQVECAVCDVRYSGRQKRYANLSNEKRLSPSQVNNIVDKETGAILGIQYNFDQPTASGSYQMTARGRHITADQIYIPKVVARSHQVALKKDDPRYRGSGYGKGQQKSVQEITSAPSSGLFGHDAGNDKSWIKTKNLTVTIK